MGRLFPFLSHMDQEDRVKPRTQPGPVHRPSPLSVVAAPSYETLELLLHAPSGAAASKQQTLNQFILPRPRIFKAKLKSNKTNHNQISKQISDKTITESNQRLLFLQIN